jgi:hypothetical protein
MLFNYALLEIGGDAVKKYYPALEVCGDCYDRGVPGRSALIVGNITS